MISNLRIIVISLFSLFAVVPLQAQKETSIKFGKVSASDFDIPLSAIVDANSHAIIVADIGETDFKGNDEGWLSYVFYPQDQD
jgi:hypothetical protein